MPFDDAAWGRFAQDDIAAPFDDAAWGRFAQGDIAAPFDDAPAALCAG